MRRFTALTVLLLLAGPARASGQSEKEQMILDAIGSSAVVELATRHMSVSEEAVRSVSSDVAIPGPGVLDVDPASTRGEWSVNYETRDLEMCRAATATAVAAVVANSSSGAWTISTSCVNSMVEVELDLGQELATGEQWRGTGAYVWRNSWRF